MLCLLFGLKTRSTSKAKDLGVAVKNLRSAERMAVLEAAAEGSSKGASIGEAVATANKASSTAEDLGLSTQELIHLKQSGQLEKIVGKGRDFFAGNPELQASYDLFEKAKQKLKPYVKKPMPEFQVRELIHETGIPTFPGLREFRTIT